MGDPKTVDATEHVVERIRWDGGRSRSLSYPCRHTLEFTPHQPPQQRTATALESKVPPEREAGLTRRGGTRVVSFSDNVGERPTD
jgi:hypothetical protein